MRTEVIQFKMLSSGNKLTEVKKINLLYDFFFKSHFVQTTSMLLERYF